MRYIVSGKVKLNGKEYDVSAQVEEANEGEIDTNRTLREFVQMFVFERSARLKNVDIKWIDGPYIEPEQLGLFDV